MKSKTIPLFALLALTVSATAFNFLSPEQEAQMGKEEFANYKASHKIIAEGPQLAMIQRVATRLTRVVNVPDAEWEFVLFDDNTPNAFALPGGKVGVHSGLFAIVQDEPQLAAVVGHELGHVKARHSGQRISNAAVSSAVGAVAGKILQSKTGMKGENAQTVTQGVATLEILKFSRKQELEADQLGAVYMAKVGYDPEEAVKLWTRFEAYQRQQGGSKMPAFLSTHPVDSKRIAELKAAMAEIKKSYRPNKHSPSGSSIKATPDPKLSPSLNLTQP